jgi:hypothetical protein
MNQVEKLIEEERWYLSEYLGYDCTTTAMGLCALNNRITTLIQFSFGKYIHKLDE